MAFLKRYTHVVYACYCDSMCLLTSGVCLLDTFDCIHAKWQLKSEKSEMYALLLSFQLNGIRAAYKHIFFSMFDILFVRFILCTVCVSILSVLLETSIVLVNAFSQCVRCIRMRLHVLSHPNEYSSYTHTNTRHFFDSCINVFIFMIL